MQHVQDNHTEKERTLLKLFVPVSYQCHLQLSITYDESSPPAAILESCKNFCTSGDCDLASLHHIAHLYCHVYVHVHHHSYYDPSFSHHLLLHHLLLHHHHHHHHHHRHHHHHHFITTSTIFFMVVLAFQIVTKLQFVDRIEWTQQPLVQGAEQVIQRGTTQGMTVTLVTFIVFCSNMDSAQRFWISYSISNSIPFQCSDPEHVQF